MEAYFALTPFGVLAFNKDLKLIGKELFKLDAKEVADKLLAKSLLPEEEKLMSELKAKGYSDFYHLLRKDGFKLASEEMAKKVRNAVRKAIDELGTFKNKQEMNKFLTEVGIEISKRKIKESVNKDAIVSQVINAIDELNKSINVFVERLREWYGLYFPELEKKMDEHEEFVDKVASVGFKQNFKGELARLAKDSVGIDLDEQDVEAMMENAKVIAQLYGLRKRLEKYLDSLLDEVAPNLKAIAGTTVAAKLIDGAGG